ncbi:hypothetical protein NQ318_002008 [Aromia moschata]|uniref:Uncharacterized protein n=1 Tax=Aromia moschata TaxID=1265417 RepID=A0AAV8Z4D3_9CUCU|nr:hypothetical protein NQ318_002008 [Aromia moschata]
MPLTHNIQKTEREKFAKYENLSIELKRLWKLKKVETYALVISAEGVMTTRFAKNIAALGLSYNIIRNVQKAVGDWVYPYRPGDYATLTRKYLGSLYWSTLTLTTIGDLPTPETNAE